MSCNLASFLSWHDAQSSCPKCPRAATSILVFLLTISSAGAHPQTAAANVPGSVQGRITCNDGAFPARGANVTLTPLSTLLTDKDSNLASAPRTQEQPQGAGAATNIDGYYSIPSVQPGIYVIDVQLPGYSQDFDLVRSVLNRIAPDRQKEMLAEFSEVTVPGAGAVRKDVVIHRGASIAGRVSFDSGGDMDRAGVKATLISSNLLGDEVSGDAHKAAYSWSAHGITDDRGVYRIAGLPHGKYRIEVQVRETGIERGGGYLTVFAPEALKEEDAKPISVGDGDELADVDISIPLRLFHSIGGIVTRDGIPIAGASVTIQPKDQTWSRIFASDSNGTYRIDLLPQGAYTVEAEFPSTETEVRGPSVRRKIPVQLGEGDVLDANLDLLSHPPAE